MTSMPFTSATGERTMRKLSKRERVFTRDLPDSYDPHHFYEYRIAKRSKEAAGIEGFLYKLMPWSLIKSFAFAIDPLSNFKTATGKISPVNRTRTYTGQSVLDTGRKATHKYTARGRGAIKNYENHPGRYGPIVDNSPYVDYWSESKSSQAKLPRISKDTTFRTRPLGYSMGEFEFSKPSIHSPQRSRFSHENVTQYYTIGSGQDYPDYYQLLKTNEDQIFPTAATYRADYYVSVRDTEANALLARMQKEALPMYKGLNPSFRSTSIFRNAVELRDLPRSVLSMRDTVKHLSELERLLDPRITEIIRQGQILSPKLIKTISNEYLSYQFGWKQLVKDTHDLLFKPSKIQKQIDFLIRRNGQATTYRSRRSFVEGRNDVPDFSYDIFGENVESIDTNLQRKITLDMVINTTYAFPEINQVFFRDDLYLEKIGIRPRLTDIYNLVPWTWLFDWFTGLGNYVDIIDEINRDRSLINWGLITGKSSIDLTTNITTSKYNNDSITVNNVGGNVQTKQSDKHASVLHLDLQLRKNVAAIFDVKTFSDPSTLTAHQNSILGALISQRTKFSRG